jgi:homoserine kinase
MAGAKLGDERILRIATEIDGHPDNVAAALFGGFVIVSHDGGGAPRAARFDPPGSLHAAVFIPDSEMRTAEMRAALPAFVKHADAARNVGGTAMVVAAFTSGRLELLAGMGEDRMHEPYRSRHISQLPDIVNAAREAGALGAALSGAGSAILALADDAKTAKSAAGAMSAAAKKTNLSGRAVVVRPAAHGARIVGVPKR